MVSAKRNNIIDNMVFWVTSKEAKHLCYIKMLCTTIVYEIFLKCSQTCYNIFNNIPLNNVVLLTLLIAVYRVLQYC